MLNAPRPRPIKIHVLPCTPGLPLLPFVSALGVGGGLKSRTTADRRIYGPLADAADSELLIVQDTSSADLLLHPHDALEHSAVARAASRAASTLRRPTIFLSVSDCVTPSTLPWGVLWRTSAYRSKLRAHERVATGDVPDLTAEKSAIHVDMLPWQARPTIGFIGHVTSGLKSFAYLRKGWQNYHGFTLRERVLRAFEASTAIETRFTRRGTNLGPPMANIDMDTDRQHKRVEYVDSVFGCDYALCIRGAGNWSFRFFEALSAGRIPVLIDTDSVLPLSDEVDWERHVCRIPIARIIEGPQIVAEFHRKLGPEGFKGMQLANRELWRASLSPTTFYLHAFWELVRETTSGR